MKHENLDERQEQKLLQIEHRAYQIAFWGLLAVMALQQWLSDSYDLKSIQGELVVFLAMCVYVLLACIRNGIWDRKLQPNGLTNLLMSLLAGLVMGALQFAISYRYYQNLLGSVFTFLIMAVVTALLCWAALTFFTGLYKRRLRKLDEQLDREPEEETE